MPATVTYDADVTDVSALAEAIAGAGYQVKARTATLPIRGMTCGACVHTLERGLRKATGVLSALVPAQPASCRLNLDRAPIPAGQKTGA